MKDWLELLVVVVLVSERMSSKCGRASSRSKARETEMAFCHEKAKEFSWYFANISRLSRSDQIK